MSSFPIQMQTYDKQSVKQAIVQFQKEYDEEIALNNTLKEQESDVKIAQATAFFNENRDVILDQHARILALDNDIRRIVLENKDLQKQDAAFDMLLDSDDYRDLATVMAELKQKIMSLDSFLVEQGVKGPPSSPPL